MKLEPATIRELLECDPALGRLWWKSRDRRWFPDVRTFNTWNTRYSGTEAFTAIRHNGYLVGNILGCHIRAHHVIWCYVYGVWPKEVDHINGVRNDNRLANLRLVNRQTNMQNSSLGTRNKSGVIGVRQMESGKWLAEICINRKNVVLGRYETIEEAALIRKNAEIIAGFHPNHGKIKC